MRRDVFQAIADPTRREILNMIAHQSLNVNSVAGHFDVSRTAINKHVKILTECGLVVMKQYGRERYCEARLQKLSLVSDWVEQYRKIWSARLDNLDNYLKQLQSTMQVSTAEAKRKQSSATETKQRRSSTAETKKKPLSQIKNKKHAKRK